MTPLLFAIGSLVADLASSVIGLRMGGKEVNPLARGWGGLAINAALLGIMFWQFNTPVGWWAFGGMHLAAAAWNTYQIVR